MSGISGCCDWNKMIMFGLCLLKWFGCVKTDVSNSGVKTLAKSELMKVQLGYFKKNAGCGSCFGINKISCVHI